MATYQKCDADVTDVVRDLLERIHYPRIGVDDITVGCIYHIADKDDNGVVTGPPLKLHGWPCAAVVKVNSLKLRAQGLPDCEITIDEYSWQERTDAEKRAILDHELEHLDVKRKANNEIKYDDLNRPMLKLRLHDYQFGGFDAIASRHGPDSIEVQWARSFMDQHGQYHFDFAKQTPGEKAEAFLAGSVRTSIRVNGGPEVPIDLDKPRKAAATLAGEFKEHGRKRAAVGGAA